jgi:hypothetical protein
MMVIPIKDRKIKKVLRELELECAKENPDGFALFGQLMTLNNGRVVLKMGSFNKEEYLTLDEIIKNRENKQADIERSERFNAELELL